MKFPGNFKVVYMNMNTWDTSKLKIQYPKNRRYRQVIGVIPKIKRVLQLSISPMKAYQVQRTMGIKYYLVNSVLSMWAVGSIAPTQRNHGSQHRREMYVDMYDMFMVAMKLCIYCPPCNTQLPTKQPLVADPNFESP